MILLFQACTRLEPGAWDIDYAPVEEDSCDLYGGAQAVADTSAELWQTAEHVVFELDGTDDDMSFTLDGVDLRSDAAGSSALDPACTLLSTQTMRGTVRSSRSLNGETRWSGRLTGECAPFESTFDPLCIVSFLWSAAYAE